MVAKKKQTSFVGAEKLNESGSFVYTQFGKAKVVSTNESSTTVIYNDGSKKEWKNSEVTQVK